MNGKTVVITGANSGIGKAAAAAIAKMGATVFITARNPERGQKALEDIRAAAGHDRVELFVADFARLDDVRALAEALKARTDTIDVLVNNAGLVLSDRTTTHDGYETTFQVNHLAPFLLTSLLLGTLQRSEARVVNVSSEAHRAGGAIDFDDLMLEKGYKGMKAYGRSKLANILFTRELARRLEGSGATANALHPGVVDTGFARDGDTRGWFPKVIQVFSPFFRTAEQGAATTIYLATSEDVASTTGGYFASEKPKRVRGQAVDQAAAQRLWEVSEHLTGLSG